MPKDKNSQRTLFIGGGALLIVIFGITFIFLHLGRAQQSCVTGYFYSNINGGCVYDTNKNGVDYAIYNGTNAADRSYVNFTYAKVGALTEDGTKRYIETKCAGQTSGYCSNASSIGCSYESGTEVPVITLPYTVTNSSGGSSARCTIDSSAPWSPPSQVNNVNSNADSIVCRSKPGFSDWSTSTAIGSNSCAWSNTWSVKCPSTAPNLFVNQKSLSSGPQSVDCITNAEMGQKPMVLNDVLMVCKNPSAYAGDTANYYFPSKLNNGFCANYNAAVPHEVVTCPMQDMSGKKFTKTIVNGAQKCELESIQAADSGAGTDTGITTPPDTGAFPSGSCPKKPDSAKGTAEPATLPAGAEIKQVPSYYLWGCYSQPDKSGGECTAQATKRTGNITSPCVYGQESVVCPSKGTAYKEGNSLKCAPVKLPKRDDTLTEPTIITQTQTVERIVTVEVPSTVSVTPPDVITEDSCAAYKKAVNDQVLAEGEALLQVADTAFKATDVKNPEFKKVFYQFLKEGAKNSRNLQKLAGQSQCSAETVAKINEATRQFESENLVRVKQSLVFLDKDTKVQNQYVGIQEDFRWVENFSKSLKADSPQAKAVSEDLKNFSQLRAEFQELVDADKEGKVFGFEIEDLVQKVSVSRKQIEQNASQYIKATGSSLKKADSKKLSKKSKKSVKKSSKKSSKKSDKKKTKKTKSPKAK